MSFLQAVFGVDKDTADALVREGVVSSYWCYHWDIYQHWLEMMAVYGYAKAATDDTCLHYQITRRHLYRILKKFREMRI